MPNNVKLAFYGGAGTIGGNAVSLTFDKNSKSESYFFDFGVEQQKLARHKSLGGTLESLEQLQRWGFLPELPKTDIRACFISHAHPDHCYALSALTKSSLAPRDIWASNTTNQMIQGKKLLARNWNLCIEPFEKTSYYEDKNVRVAPFPTDHNIPGACAYLTRFADQVVVYTGDFREHGSLSRDMGDQFWKYVKRTSKKSDNITLITEGTNFGLPHKCITEHDIQERVKEVLSNSSDQLLLVIVSDRDIWRLMTILEALKQAEPKRKLIVAPKLAGTINHLSEQIRSDYKDVLQPTVFDLYSKNILFLQKSMFADSPAYKSGLSVVAEKPSQHVILATRAEGFQSCEDLFSYMRYRDLCGCCILSLSEYVEQESGSSTNDYARSISELGLSVEEAHSCGHIFPTRLVEIIQELNPKGIYLIHTIAPDGLRRFIKGRTGIDAITPKVGEQYSL